MWAVMEAASWLGVKLMAVTLYTHCALKGRETKGSAPPPPLPPPYLHEFGSWRMDEGQSRLHTYNPSSPLGTHSTFHIRLEAVGHVHHGEDLMLLLSPHQE